MLVLAGDDFEHQTVNLKEQTVQYYLVLQQTRQHHATHQTELHTHSLSLFLASSAATTSSVLSLPEQNNICGEITSHEQM
jgi:hypothetical protein